MIENGRDYLFRTVTMIYTGTVRGESHEYYLLQNAAWIADTGRWSQALKDPDVFKEVEMYPKDKQVYVFKSGMLDVVEIDRLPTATKP